MVSTAPDLQRAPLVLHVIFRLDYGGLENGLVNLVNRMAPGRFRHAIVCLAGYSDFSKRIARADVRVYSLDKRPGKDLRAYLRFWRLLRQMRPDIVHTRNLGTVDLQWIARVAGVRGRIHGEHGWDAADPRGSGARGLTIRRACRAAIQRYVAMSRDLARWLETAVGIAPGRITQIYNGVDSDKFSPRGALPADLPWAAQPADGRVVFGTVGRLDPIKNQGALLEAFAALVGQEPAGSQRLRLIVVGDGPLATTLRTRAQELGVGALVWFTGARNDIPDLLRAMDVFVLPSLNEGISNTLLEAMATARAVIAARVGGNPELVEPDVTGTLYDAGEQGALTAAMREYSRSAERIARRGVAARERVVANFGIGAMVDRYTALYEQLSAA
jgi:sugar transferase (PEP-CTERM/EpsH1 system associated)